MPTKILDVDLAELSEPIPVAGPYGSALLLLRWHGVPLGKVWLEVERGVISGCRIWRAAVEALGERLSRAAIVDLLPQLAEAPHSVGPRPSASVLICTHDRPHDLRRCLDSILVASGSSPDVEIIAIDNAPSDRQTARLVADYPVRYVLEPRKGLNWARSLGARVARNEILIYADDDTVVDPHWIDSMLQPFTASHVGAVTGLVMPAELETPAQEEFEHRNGFGRGFERRAHSVQTTEPTLVAQIGAGASLAIRRKLVLGMELFDVELGAGTAAMTGDDHHAFFRLLSTGHVIVYNPEALSWHFHRRTDEKLAATLRSYSVGAYCHLLRALLVHGEFSALRVCFGYFYHHHWRQLWRGLRGHPDAQPLALTLAEIRGVLRSPGAILNCLRREPQRRLYQSPGLSLPPRGTDVMPELSVIIPTCNRSQPLVRALTSLASQNGVAPERFEVIVVGDGHQEESERAVRALQLPYSLTFLEQPGLGPASARNRGAEAASAPLLLFLDDDMEASPGLLAAHLAAHTKDPGGVVLGYFPIPPSYSETDVFRLGVKLWWDEAFDGRSKPTHRYNFADLCTGNVSLPRDLFQAVDGFDPRFTREIAGEDYDLGAKLIKRRVRFRFVREAASTHHDRPSPTRLQRRARAEGSGNVLLVRKHPELFGVLPRLRNLTRFELKPASRLLWRLVWWQPALGRLVTWPLRLPLALARAAKLRSLMWKIYFCMHGYYYFLGVRSALGSRAEWERLVADATQARVDWREVEIDVATDLPRLDELLAEASADSAILKYREHELGRYAPQVGAEPLRGPHVRDVLLRYYSGALLGLVMLDRLHVPEEPAPLTSTDASPNGIPVSDMLSHWSQLQASTYVGLCSSERTPAGASGAGGSEENDH